MKFTTRDLFWLTVVIGLALGWWLDHGHLRAMNAYLGRTWIEHIRKEHPGQQEFERLTTELTMPRSD